MKKAIVCMGIGEKYRREMEVTRPFRQHYAERHGWDLVEVSELDPRCAALGSYYGTGLRCLLQKLLLPDAVRDYDLALFMDVDILLHPGAPCISVYDAFLGEGDVGAVGCTLDQERKPVFGFPDSHYRGMAEPRLGAWQPAPVITVEDFYMNSGVLLFRPREVQARWLALFENNCGHNEENLLNLFDVQNRRVLWLPSEWNKVWLYQKVRLGFMRPFGSLANRVLNRVINRYGFRLFPWAEKRLFRKHFPTAYFHHIVQEGWKLEALAKVAAKGLPGRPANAR